MFPANLVLHQSESNLPKNRPFITINGYSQEPYTIILPDRTKQVQQVSFTRYH